MEEIGTTEELCVTSFWKSALNFSKSFVFKSILNSVRKESTFHSFLLPWNKNWFFPHISEKLREVLCRTDSVKVAPLDCFQSHSPCQFRDQSRASFVKIFLDTKIVFLQYLLLPYYWVLFDFRLYINHICFTEASQSHRRVSVKMFGILCLSQHFTTTATAGLAELEVAEVAVAPSGWFAWCPDSAPPPALAGCQ